MNSKLILISIGLSLLSVVFMFLSYYGFTRLYKIQTGECKSFAEGYLKLQKAPTPRKIIVSIAGDSFENLKATIMSLFDQTFRPDQIIISIPPNSTMDLDPFILENNLITVHKLSKDYGKCCNILSPLLREKDGDAIIILASQNTVYGTDFIENMVEESEKNPDCAIYIYGYNAKHFIETGKKVDKNSDVIQVDNGVLIKPKFISENILDEQAYIDNPNVFLSAHINKNNICMKKITYTENFVKKVDRTNEKLAIEFYASNLNSFN
jgi:hypothetical protein